MVTINELVTLVARVAGKRLSVMHVEGPQGVRGRNSDNTRLRQVLGWEPGVPLEEGLAQTYAWIHALLEREGRIQAPLVGSGSGSELRR